APASRSEELATVGLELHRLGKKAEAAKALEEALKPFKPNKDKKQDNKGKEANPPELRAAVVALAILEGKEPPAPGKNLVEESARRIGEAEGWARMGQLKKAREPLDGLPTGGDDVLLGKIAVAVGAAETKNGTDDIQAALDAVKQPGGAEAS